MADDKDKEPGSVTTLKPKKPEKIAKVLAFDPNMMTPRKVLQEAMDHVDQVDAVLVIIVRKDGGVGLDMSDMDASTLSVLVHRAQYEIMSEINASLVIEDDDDPDNA